jgi:hypothetical protein
VVTAAYWAIYNSLGHQDDEADIGREIQTKLFKYYSGSDGKLKFSADIKSSTLTVDESGKITVGWSAGAFNGSYELGEGLKDLGLKVPGAE